MLHPGEAADPRVMAEALRRLPFRPVPSELGSEHMLNGLDVIGDMVVGLIERYQKPKLSVIEGGY
jgi:hypothetical protein